MSKVLPPLLVIDDERNMRLSLETILSEDGYDVRAVDSAEEGLRRLEAEDHFVVISDARLGGMSGYKFLAEAKQRWPHTPIIIITAFATPRLAVEAIQAGAMDYLAKPFAPEELLHSVARCAERYGLLRENADLRARTAGSCRLEQIIGDSPPLQELRTLIQTVAPTDATVLILGESGTGKELIAGSLHHLSRRRGQPYVRINCAAIPETLLESELFGHEKGSFTGALKQKHGRVEEADGGTMFLDEIGDMSRPLQAKLLRFLEDGTFARVGGVHELRVNVRLIAATNKDIIEAIRNDAFREDLYHRLNVVQFRAPPLRDRGDDVLLLAEHFLRHFALGMNRAISGFTDSARRLLMSHSWPGNVRELKNAVERAVILETGDRLGRASLPDFELESRLHAQDQVVFSELGLEEMMGEFERKCVQQALNRNHYNLAKTADQLRITRHALRYRMNRLEMNVTNEDESEEPASARE